jgi:hypothetical protein
MPKTRKQDSSSAKDESNHVIHERGRYYDALQQGHSVRIHEDDGTTNVQIYRLDEGTVLLDPDVREYFPDAKAVNAALRSLIDLIPARQSSHRGTNSETRASQ